MNNLHMAITCKAILLETKTIIILLNVFWWMAISLAPVVSHCIQAPYSLSNCQQLHKGPLSFCEQRVIHLFGGRQKNKIVIIALNFL